MENLQIEFEEPLEEDVSEIYRDRKINIDKGDPNVYSLYGNYKDGKLLIQPDFQRYFVWDMKKASRLVESILLEIPLQNAEAESPRFLIVG